MPHDIIALIPVYNDVDCVKRLHSKLLEMGIYSIWGDGKFPLFESINDSSLSTDGTREYLQDAFKVLLLDYPDITLPDKLTQMLHIAGRMGYKYAITFGADEIPEGNFEELVKTIDQFSNDEPMVFNLPFITTDEYVYSLPNVERVFKFPDRISVRGAHYLFYRDDETEAIRSSMLMFTSIKVHHDHTIRPKDRDKKMTDYQIKRIGEEKKHVLAEHYKLPVKPNYETLNKLYPNNEILEEENQSGKKIFKVIGTKDTGPLLSSWKRTFDKKNMIILEY